MTIKEIAKLAGVSISTVSKIVNNKDQNINQETRNRVLKIVKDYNYTPYGTVKNISSAKTFLLGVLLKDISSYGRMLNGILEAAQDHGYRIILFDSCRSAEEELKHIAFLTNNKVDGILWEPVCPESLRHEQDLAQAKIPVCYLHSPAQDAACSVDYQRIGYLCAEKLISYRHHKLCCLMKKNSYRSEQVFEGFKKCLFEHQLTYEDSMELYAPESASVSEMISRGYTGVVSTHFSSSLWLYKEMSRLHYGIPSDLSLISLRSDGREFICYPPISSFEIPYYYFGYELCKRLINTCEKAETDDRQFTFTEDYRPDHEESLSIPSDFRKKKIVVVGSINKDITFTVETLPQTGESVLIQDSSVCPGGKGANQAVGSARLGHEVALIGKLGNDMESHFIFDILEKENVGTAGIKRDANSQTGKAYIYSPKDGNGTITILPGANTLLAPEDLRSVEYLFTNAAFCLLSTEISVDSVHEAAILAKKHGGKTILKPAAITAMPECLLSQTDIFIPNKKEAALLAPHNKTLEAQADYFFEQGIPVVIITLGHEGCYLRTADQRGYFPAAEFSSIDTTGGADAFICALAVYLSDGYTLEEAIRIAQYAAGFCVSRQGVTPALVDKNTLHSHISQLEPGLL